MCLQFLRHRNGFLENMCLIIKPKSKTAKSKICLRCCYKNRKLYFIQYQRIMFNIVCKLLFRYLNKIICLFI